MVPNINQKTGKGIIPSSSLYSELGASHCVWIYESFKPMRKNIRFVDYWVFFTVWLICIIKAKCLFSVPVVEQSVLRRSPLEAARKKVRKWQWIFQLHYLRGGAQCIKRKLGLWLSRTEIPVLL